MPRLRLCIAKCYFLLDNIEQAIACLESAYSIAGTLVKGELIRQHVLSTLYHIFLEQGEEIGKRIVETEEEIAKLQNQRSWREKFIVPDINEEAYAVDENSIGFSSEQPMGAYNINCCTCLMLRNPETGKTALVNFDTDNFLWNNRLRNQLRNIIEKHMSISPETELKARIVGARPRRMERLNSAMKAFDIL